MINSLESGVDEMIKRYAITTAQYNAKPNEEMIRSLNTYSKHTGAEVIVLPTVGKSLREEKLLGKTLEQYVIATKDFSINKNLSVKDFGVRPQQINPLTGIERFAQGDRSYILPGTKQVLKYVANNNNDIPKAIMTTGAITHPYYNEDFRIGRIARNDHEYGFVAVDVVNNKYFHFRHVTSLKNGKFVDLGTLYNGSSRPKKAVTKGLIPGDVHPYDTNKDHDRCTMQQIEHFNPENLFLHDSFNGYSISHHYKGRASQWNEAFNRQGLSLEEELKYTAKAIEKYAQATKGTVYIVPSNHDEFLKRYLDEGRFINDKGNNVLGALLYARMMKGANPLAVGLHMYGLSSKNVVFLDREQDLKIAGYQLANHGDLGANGGRGSVQSIERANGKSITGHTHGAQKIRNTYKVGTSTNLRLSYNKGYSSWTNTNAVLYEGGLVQLLNTINKRWKA